MYPERLRFDFSNNGAVKAEALQEIEDACNKQLQDAVPVYAMEVPLQDAQQIKGLRAVFGEVVLACRMLICIVICRAIQIPFA